MKRKLPPHPGEYLRHCLERDEVSMTGLAKQLRVSLPYISDICNGRRGISTEMAIKLAKRFCTEPRFWLVMQVDYDVARCS